MTPFEYIVVIALGYISGTVWRIESKVNQIEGRVR
jgi:hypothetical protein